METGAGRNYGNWLRVTEYEYPLLDALHPDKRYLTDATEQNSTQQTNQTEQTQRY